MPDFYNILRAVSVLALSLLVLDYVLVAPNVLGAFFFGKLTIILYWFLQVFFLGGPRIAYRHFRYSRTRQRAMAANSASVLVLCRAADAEVLLRAIESGAVKKIWPVGILSPSPADQGQSVRVSIMGTLDDLESVDGLKPRLAHVEHVHLPGVALLGHIERGFGHFRPFSTGGS